MQDMLKSHELIDKIERELTTQSTQLLIHMDPINKDDEQSNNYKAMIAELAKQIDERITIHDFRMVQGTNSNNLIFDIVLPMNLKLSDEQVKENLSQMVHSQDTTCNLVINIDKNYTEC